MSLLLPTYHGYIMSNEDALLVIEGALKNKFQLVKRRPLDRERPGLIRLGSVFVFIEELSDIKRWTDGIAWLASRILGRFLIYRQLDKSGLLEKDDRRKARRANDQRSRSESGVYSGSGLDKVPDPARQRLLPAMPVAEDQGLIKKTLLLTLFPELGDDLAAKQTIHLISYYSAYDVLAGHLLRPLQLDLKHMPILPELWQAVKRSPLGGKTAIDSEANFFLDSNYQLQNMALLLASQRGRPLLPGRLLLPTYPTHGGHMGGGLQASHMQTLLSGPPQTHMLGHPPPPLMMAWQPLGPPPPGLFLLAHQIGLPANHPLQSAHLRQLAYLHSMPGGSMGYLPQGIIPGMPNFQFASLAPKYDDGEPAKKRSRLLNSEVDPTVLPFDSAQDYEQKVLNPPSYDPRAPQQMYSWDYSLLGSEKPPHLEGYGAYAPSAPAPLNNSAFGVQPSQTQKPLFSSHHMELPTFGHRFETTVRGVGGSAVRRNNNDDQEIFHDDYI